jgi:hypothetical protein
MEGRECLEALREAIGVLLPLSLRADDDRQVIAAHAVLGEEVFATAWAGGRVTALEDAVAEAVAEETADIRS